MKGKICRGPDIQKDRSRDRRLEGQTLGRIDVWMDKHLEGRKNVWKDRHSERQMCLDCNFTKYPGITKNLNAILQCFHSACQS